MTTLNVVEVRSAGDAVLYHPTARVRQFGPQLHTLLDNMRETLHEAGGVGLAAPQIGISQRITVIEYPDDEEDPENTMRLYELINPEVIRQKGREVGQEGCLSIPGLAADVDRATYVLVRAQDRNGKQFRLKAYDWLARIVQHEIDHLHGVMMTDKAEQLYQLVENDEGEVEAVPIENTLRRRRVR